VEVKVDAGGRTEVDVLAVVASEGRFDITTVTTSA